MKCCTCGKEFLYFGGSTSEEEEYYCSPECTEKEKK
jgi:hypothetical protein